jgi:methanogenic corrinoid protein MtbC1
MQDQLARGLSAAEAARVARQAAPTGTAYPLVTHPTVDELSPAEAPAAMNHYRALQRALDAYDESDAQHVLDTMLRELSLTTVLRDVVMPYLAELGARWQAGTIDVAQEHFASNLLRGRLAGLALGWGQGVGPRAVLACPGGELHDLPLMIFGIMLNRSGWCVTFLGNNTPVTDLDSAVHHLEPQVVVLSATTAEPFAAEAAGLRALATRFPVLLAGAGATPEVVAAIGIPALPADPVTEALRLQAPRLAVPAGARS